ncbi:MAG: hypothetical protein QM723_36660 [Myxococcaceae bacterium]
MSALDSIRIRLEGALETVEQATDDAGAAWRGLRGRQWRAWLNAHRPQLERIASEVEQVDRAATRVEAIALVERWGEGFDLVSRLRDARARLLQQIASLDGEPKRVELVELGPTVRGFLARAADESMPLYVCERQGLQTPLEGVVFGGMLSVLLWLMTRDFNAELILAIGIAAVMMVFIGPVANRYRIEFFPKHIRIRSPLKEKRFMLSDELFGRESAGILKVRGERLLELGAVTCDQILALQKLFSGVDWPRPVPRPIDAYVAQAAELSSSGRGGAVIACDGKVHFLQSGQRSYDVVARVSQNWPRTDATLLGSILLGSPRAFRDDLFERLAAEGCLVTMAPDTQVIVTRTTATFGDVAAVGMNRETRAELEDWLKRFKGLRLQRR